MADWSACDAAAFLTAVVFSGTAMRRISLIVALLVGWSPSTAEGVSLTVATAAASKFDPASGSRFSVSAEIRPTSRSADGRFTLESSVRVVPVASSVDGRFALKAVQVPDVGCDPLGDGVFANGFENP